jgi:hypothetical protein
MWTLKISQSRPFRIGVIEGTDYVQRLFIKRNREFFLFTITEPERIVKRYVIGKTACVVFHDYRLLIFIDRKARPKGQAFRFILEKILVCKCAKLTFTLNVFPHSAIYLHM